ncbi:MAG: 2-C-methyl-D-erythritol 4-phosphate cytidylyltransferase [Acidobacteriota bacterium]|nr:2-C-methyl-D-erythritol 4-phosphate cytidylyltransferase [Acidobacteriota bacterium]
MSRPSLCTCATRERLGSAPQGPDACAVIVAGGSGERFGDPRGKQFVELCGLPIMAWSILAFDHAPSVGHIVVVCPHGRLDEVRRDVLADMPLRCELTLALAGATRQDSVFSGLVAMPPDFELVAIHDGARPLVEVGAIERCIQVVRGDERLSGAILASRETDTLKLTDAADNILATPDRSNYWCAQTPQVFRARAIIAAHKAAVWDDFVATDDASLVEHRGGRVRVVESTRDNIKITLPEDLALAEATLARRLERGE